MRARIRDLGCPLSPSWLATAAALTMAAAALVLGCSSGPRERADEAPAPRAPRDADRDRITPRTEIPSQDEIRAKPGSAPSGPVLRLATYNIHADDPGHADTLAAIAELDVDVVLLQEVSRAWREHLREAVADDFPHVGFWPHRQRWGGLAVLSRHPFDQVKLVSPGAGPFPAWTAVLHTPLGAIQLVNVHLFPPIRLHRRLGWLRAYRESQAIHVKEIAEIHRSLPIGPRARSARRPAETDAALDPELPCIIAGDFNEDVHGAAIAWLGERGFAPTIDEFTPTWRWQTRGGEVTWQLDHILHRGLRRIDSRVVQAGGSDHLPVVATFAAP